MCIRDSDIYVTYTPRRAPDDTVHGLVVLVQDITAYKQAQEALRESEATFRRIVELAREGIWFVDAKGDTTFVNQRMADLLGRTTEELLGTHALDHIHPDDRE